MNNKDIIKDWFASIDANTLEKNASMLAANHSFQSPMTPAPIGGDDHIGLIKGMLSGFTGKHHIGNVVSDGDYVVAQVTWKGTHTGDFNGVPATGRPVEFPLLDMMKIENGKITDEHMELNPMSIMAQIGAMPS